MKTKGKRYSEKDKSFEKLSKDRSKFLAGDMTIIDSGRWWKNLVTIEKPIPHIPARHISMVMPEDIKPMWETWIRGQTGLHCEDGDFGVYIWDWERFIGKLERGQPLVDSSAEWD